jgi:hypothetical protein
MTEPRGVVLAISVLVTGCGGLTALPPTSPSALTAVQPFPTSTAPFTTPAPAHTVGPDVPAGLVPATQVINAAVGPLTNYAAPCYVGLYACEKYRFTLQREGAVEVALAWQGSPRGMLIQLYRAGAGLLHEDVAPRDGAPTITFRRTSLEPMEYELRVVNWEPQATHPFTLTYTTWQ